jgi:hypothetical protein
MVKRIAHTGVVSFVLLAAYGAVCQRERQSLPDAPSAQATNQEQNFSGFIEEARSPLRFGGLLEQVGVMRQSEFVAIGRALSRHKESNTLFGKYLCPSVAERQPDDHSSGSSSLIGRATYAASHVFVSWDDLGKVRLNTPYFLKTLTSVAADTASSPYWKRSLGAPFGDFGSTVGNDAGMNLLHEFEPDIQQVMKNHTPRIVSKIEERFGHN